MSRKNVFMVSAIIVVLVLAVIMIFTSIPEEPQIIGGDRDSHGCLGPAGYSWNEEEQECVREWEEGELRYQITSFESCVDAGYEILESYPRQCRTPSGRNFIEPTETKDYVSTSVEECRLIKFMCVEGKKPFFDEIGCGCESDTEKITYCDIENRPTVCTKEYNPVCGLVDNGVRCITTPCRSTDAITFSNPCTACAGEALSYYPLSCAEQEFVVCKETVTGFSAEEYAQSSGGVCVDICPANFDSYTTQTGIELCIEHYGVQEIEAWNTCERSTSTCDCVKAYETTDSEPIEDSKYRCVSEKYSNRLLFRAGIDRLDENGLSSVLIA